VAGLGLGPHEELGAAGHVCSFPRVGPHGAGQPAGDRDVEQGVVATVVVDLVDAVPGAVVGAQARFVAMRGVGPLPHPGGAGEDADLVELATRPARPLAVEGLEQRRVGRGVVADQLGNLVGHLMCRGHRRIAPRGTRVGLRRTALVPALVDGHRGRGHTFDEETPMTETPAAPSMAELLGADAPSNWGKWGPDDEVGSLNYLDAAQVLRGTRHIVSGEVFTLQTPMGHPHGDPVFPGRESIHRENVLDESSWDAGRDDAPAFPGGLHYADDKAEIFLQGSTQYDALGHVWYNGQIWNGYDARSTVEGLSKASVAPIASRGVAGRGVLLDMARHRGKRWLDKGETFDHTDLEAAAAAQGVTLEPRDVLLVRTGFLSYFYEVSAEEFYADFLEPGLTYSRELVEWFQSHEIPNLVTDTIANEVTKDPESGVMLPLHCALMRNLGVVLTEICRLDALADACAADGRWTFLYTAAPRTSSRAPARPSTRW